MTKKTRKPTKPAKSPKQSRAAKPANQVAPVKKSNPAKPPAKVYILFGADEHAKPRAARFSAFSAEDTALLAKAAASLHVRLVEVTNPDLIEVATKLPAGRLHASGGGLVPYIKGPLYLDLIAANLSDVDPPASPDPTPPRNTGQLGRNRARSCRDSERDVGMRLVGCRCHRRTGDLVTVRYRDYPDCPSMIRHRSAIALISPAAK
jgi:hypothetical protein